MKRLFTSIIVALAAIAAGAQEFTADGFTYKVLRGNTVALTRVPTETEGEVTIPSTVSNNSTTYTVTQINTGTSGSDCAFYGCNLVTSITIPASVTTIVGYLAYDATACNNVSFLDGDAPITYTNPNTEQVPYDNLYLGREIVSGNHVCFFSRVKHVTVGPKVTTIPSKMFNDNRELVSVDMSQASSLTTIEEYAFQDCQNLPSVVMPSSLRFIGEEAFENCFALASVTLNEGLEELDNGAFYDTDALIEITIPGSVKKIGRAPFFSHGDRNMARLVIADSDTPLEFNNSDPNYSWGNGRIDDSTLEYFYLGRNLTILGNVETIVGSAKTIEIGSKVTNINERFCYENNSLEQVMGMENVESIGNYAFSGCTNLTSIELGNKLTTLGVRAFDHSGITSITLPSTLKVIPGAYDDYGVFERCYNLASVTLNEGLEEIGSAAFYNVLALTEITIPSTVKRIGRAPFYCNQGESSMKRIIIADSDTPLQFDNGTSEHSYGYGHLTDNDMIDYIYLGRNVTRELTGDPLVWGCHDIEIGPKVTDIGILFNKTPESSNDDNQVRNVKVHHVEPIAISDDAFLDKTFNNATLWVPGGTVADYQAAEGWKNFSNMQTWSYVVNFAATGHGSIAIDDEVAKGGETKLTRKPNGDELNNSRFTVTLTPETGYELTSLTQEDLTEATQAEEIFKGNESFTNPFTVETAINHDLSYVATFAPITYTITYDLAGGILDKENPNTFTIESEAITLTNPTRTGYEFLGWTGTGLTEPTMTVTIAKGSIDNRTYTATWKANSYKVHFDANNGEGEMADQTFTYDEAAKALTANAFTRLGYTFTGWNSQADGSGTAYTDEQEVKNLTATDGATITLYAQWQIVTYTITYNLDGGTVEGNPTEYTVETETFTLENPAREGYTFTGWTGTGLTEPTMTVTIVKGSTGEREYSATYEEIPVIIPADVNGDGAVDVADIATVISVMAGSAAQFETAADVNGDGAVDVADIASIISEMAARARMQEVKEI